MPGIMDKINNSVPSNKSRISNMNNIGNFNIFTFF